ncbi:Zn-dependent hydrolase, glyoxylase [Desulfosporosinus orientis DSM 765]|uniref:Zn-dependent hydrolase, glyoxylase n=1 Tax=Desulfosporosinus orientis (strain ATCC 19365 / DSM 765 / NCIMB 8382 / VKM B-1628 / Singapore I) TaxID=768706 RepID=G7WC10_DESOD|nr:MBL fold metallo-hydrolase [Desulfosporosinus orientis]AET69984.1 Zn-dependent hydrolase, glyoxylase [Desulfosporosinus orientis DSM 765]
MIYQPLGIYKVTFPLPFRLNHVNCYAVKGTPGWWLIDAGLQREATIAGWKQFFEEQAIKPSDIKGIYLTHFHPDHYGCSGWLQKYTGAPVYIGEIDAERVRHYWKSDHYILDDLNTLFKENGMPEDILNETISSVNNLIRYTAPHAELTTLKPGQMVMIGDFKYQVILTPGHTDGHICFYNLEEGVLLSGDHLLPEISSNISLWPQTGADPDPLANFLRAIDGIRSLSCKLVLPAHGNPFSAVEERICQLEAHHKARLQEIKNYAGSGSTAYQVCKQVFRQDLSFHELRFAMAETLAHLVYLIYKGELEKFSIEGIDYFKIR